MKDILMDRKLRDEDPILRNTEKWYEFTRSEMHEHQLKKLARFWELHKERYFTGF
jgi:hypothetical protein